MSAPSVAATAGVRHRAGALPGALPGARARGRPRALAGGRVLPRARARAFTLIEVLVVLAIVGILTAIALPAYVGYVVQARRVEGQVALLLLMQQQERYFSENNTYLAFAAGASDPAARRFQWWSGSAAASSAYELAGQACEGQAITACIELRATPGTDKVDSHFRDAACGALSLSSDGSHKAGGRAEHCWP